MVLRRRVDNLFEISNEETDRIKKQIGEDEDRLRHIEDLLDQWIQCEQHLPKTYDRDMMRNFIRGSKFNFDIVKRKLEGHFFAKFAFPYFYYGRNPTSKEILDVFDTINIVRLPRLTEDGERICVLSLHNPDPVVFDITASIKLFWMLYDLMLTCKFSVASEVFIFDCKGVTPNHMVKFLSSSFKNSISILRNAYATRISQIHLINSPAIAEKVIAAVRPLLHVKVRERLVIHKGTESLHKYLPTKLLPEDFGGNLGNMKDYMKQWQEISVEHLEWFEEQEKVKIIGKPPKRMVEFSNNICLEGSFRQLSID